MAKYYVDFVGLNTFMYNPVGFDVSNEQLSIESIPFVEKEQNLIGIKASENKEQLESYKNYRFPFDLPNTASFFPALMLHRNGPYGYPMWKQIRVSENPLTRKQNKENILTIIQEPINHINAKIIARFLIFCINYNSLYLSLLVYLYKTKTKI